MDHAGWTAAERGSKKLFRRGARLCPCPFGAPLRGRTEPCPTAELRPHAAVPLAFRLSGRQSPLNQQHEDAFPVDHPQVLRWLLAAGPEYVVSEMVKLLMNRGLAWSDPNTRSYDPSAEVQPWNPSATFGIYWPGVGAALCQLATSFP